VAPPASLRVVLLGGARAPEPLLDRAQAAGWPVLATYGLTEACSQVATQRPDKDGRGPSGDAGCGPPLPGMELRSAGVVTGAASAGAPTAGEILLRGPSLFSGYLQLEGASLRFERAVFDACGFFATGDIGLLDDRGCLHVLDRRTDLIVSGGENVYPAEVEQVLERCPGIAVACVLGVEDEEWGHVVAAAVVAPRGPVDETVLHQSLDTLAPFKRPRRIVYLADLPLLPNGKPDRAACRKLVSGRAR
jgi:O-succinylbenzoic acid--CoA ligase